MDRRSFLKTAGLTAAGTAVAATATESFAASPSAGGAPQFLSVPTRDRLSPASSDLSPWSPSASQPWDVHTINHLYRRAGFGATLTEISAASKLTPGQVVDALLDDTLLSRPTVPPLPTHAVDPSKANDKQQPQYWLYVPPTDYGGNSTAEMNDYAFANMKIRSHWTVQMNQPEVMLREKMVMFWMNHFVVEAKKVYYPQSMYNYLAYFRQNAWGNFKKMVSDVTTSPAMLIYLDGILNVASNGSVPNENYAREVQELFTMGAVDKKGNANYTQADIEALAVVFSGWQVENDAPAPNVLPAGYFVSRHGTARLAIYDTTQRIYNLKASGSTDTDIFDHMFDQRGEQIAWFICSKLYQYFVYHDITGASDIIDAMATTFIQSNWELKPVIAQLLKSAHFFDEANIGDAIKSPYEHLIGLIRTFDIQIDELAGGTLYYYALAGAQELLDPPNVKGWPGYHNWLSTTTLPYRNNTIETDLLGQLGSLPALGADGYGNNHAPITLPDLITWGKQFVNYNGQWDDIVAEVARYLCAQPPSQKALDYIKNPFGPNIVYEWTSATDSDKAAKLRQLAKAIMLLADFQLS